MDEYFLHFLWQFQKVNNLPLKTSKGDLVSVIKTGYPHDHSGPDFEEARIKIGDIHWNGPIEIHYRSSDWLAHKHDQNPSYDAVILHVVWIHDQEITYQDGKPIPTLILKDFVDQDLETHYRNYINQTADILCSNYELTNLLYTQMKDHALAERLAEKARNVSDIYNQVNADWEEVAFRVLGQNLGFSINKDSFIHLTSLIPFKILKKHANSLLQLEALIFGQAGFLDKVEDPYQETLKKEFNFLSKKFSLKPPMHKMQWNFLRLRPANFPTIRLAQLVGMIKSNPNLFSWLIESQVDLIKTNPTLEISEYWQKHYDFGKQLKSGKNSFGPNSWSNLVINTIVPLKVAYSQHIDNLSMYDEAVELLNSIKPENNKFTRKWENMPISIENAFDSQALLFQYKEYCVKKKCLQCNIGVHILKRI